MAAAQASQQTVAPPSNEKLHRLAVEAGKYLGLEQGEQVPTDEIVAQGEANGYTERETRALLTRDGYMEAEGVPVPPQGDSFGQLWNASEVPEGNPEPTSEPVGEKGYGTLEEFRDWCEERANSDQSHTYTRQKANRRFARGKDVDRSFVQDYEEFSTVLITYSRERDGESLAEHAESFYPRQVTRKRRRILKRENVYQEHAGVSLLAPKSPDRVPHASTPTTHAHDSLWLPEHVEAEAFAPLREIESFDVHVSVEHHTSAEVETPDSVTARGSGLDAQRGATTALPQELAANLPLLTCKFDARGTPEYVEQWCAHLRAGTDGSFSKQGVRRFIKLGSFKERADSQKVRRKVQKAEANARALVSELECHTPSHQNQDSVESPTDSTEEEHEFLGETGGESNTNDSAKPEFNFTENRVPQAGAPDEQEPPDESRFTFHEHG